MSNPVNAQDLLELIEGYKSYEADCRQSETLINISRANLYKTIRHDLEALLPTPPRPTLADMTPEEREACQWMQAELYGYEDGAVITKISDRASVLYPDGTSFSVSLKEVTPLPDLARLDWAGIDGVVDAVIHCPECNCGNETPTEWEGANGQFPDPEQPRVLSTLSDYENAPTGTIVAQAGASPYVLTRNGMWGNKHRHEMNHPQASEESRTVLRWGWGERA